MFSALEHVNMIKALCKCWYYYYYYYEVRDRGILNNYLFYHLQYYFLFSAKFAGTEHKPITLQGYHVCVVCILLHLCNESACLCDIDDVEAVTLNLGLNKEKWTSTELEPATSGLTYRRSIINWQAQYFVNIFVR